MKKSMTWMTLGLALLAACGERSPTGIEEPGVDAPHSLDGRYEWALDGWVGVRPAGQATVVLTWQLPTLWRNEPFRVYARQSGSGNYRLIATVTSCSEGWCRYADADVVAGRSYDYYVAAVDEATGREVTSPSAIAVEVPAFSQPTRPEAPRIIALDNILYLNWSDVDLGGRLWKYLVFQERRDDDSVFFEIGSTDGHAFLDVLAQNGVAYRYSIAAVDLDGHISDRSPLSLPGTPRPDAHGELIFAFSDNAQASGFEFDAAAHEGRVVAGESAQANFRFEAGPDGWELRPLAGAAILDAGFTTALTCGPGSDPGCISVQEAPASGYQEGAIEAQLEHTYVLRVGSGSGTRYAKLRVQILGFDQDDRRLLIFDWAFQTVAGERNLNLM
jgi:hypothetical protein